MLITLMLGQKVIIITLFIITTSVLQPNPNVYQGLMTDAFVASFLLEIDLSVRKSHTAPYKGA